MRNEVMSFLRYPNDYFKNRSWGKRHKLEQNFLNKLQFFINDEIKPSFVGLVRARASLNNPAYFKFRYNELRRLFGRKLFMLSQEHFAGILRLSLVEKYGAWHKVPPEEVQKMLDKLMKQSKFRDKSDFLVNRMFENTKDMFAPTLKEMGVKDFPRNIMEEIAEEMSKDMSAIGRTIYTHTTYFINSAYEIQFKQRDPQNVFLFLWQTRPDLRRTVQCEMIDQMVKDEAKRDKEGGISIDRLKAIVTQVGNMEGFKKANPGIDWVPHYNCRSGIRRIV